MLNVAFTVVMFLNIGLSIVFAGKKKINSSYKGKCSAPDQYIFDFAGKHCFMPSWTY